MGELEMRLIHIVCMVLLLFGFSFSGESHAQTGTEPAVTWKPIYIYDPLTKLYLTAENVNNGKRLTLSRFTGADSQKFFITRWGDDKTTRGHSLAPNRSRFQVASPGRTNYNSNAEYKRSGTFLWLYAWGNGGNQLWDIEHVDKTVYRLKNQHSNHYLAPGPNGQAIQSSKVHNWSIHPVKGYKYEYEAIDRPNGGITTKELNCANRLNDGQEIAYDQAGNRNWRQWRENESPSPVGLLCRGVSDVDALFSCFEEQIEAGRGFETARAVCKAAPGVLDESRPLTRKWPNDISATEQKVTGGFGNRKMRVAFYRPEQLWVDNSEPWRTRLLFKRSPPSFEGGMPECGFSIAAQETVCRGAEPRPITTLTVDAGKKGIIGVEYPFRGRQGLPASREPSIAIVWCEGCASYRSQFISVSLDAVAAWIPLPAGAELGAIAISYVQGELETFLKDYVDASAGAQADSDFAVQIHDITDIPHYEDIVYIGAPENLVVGPDAFFGNVKDAGRTPKYGYDVEIDCYSTDMDNTDTVNNVKIDFLFSVGSRTEVVGSDNHAGRDIDCGDTDSDSVWKSGPMPINNMTAGSTPVVPTSIRVAINGDDAFLIDEIKMFRTVNGERVSEDLVRGRSAFDGGTDNICLSLDPNDGNGSWKKYIVPGCKSAYEWKVLK